MGEAQLHALLSLVHKRLDFLHQMRDLQSLQKFHVFDKVIFEHRGEQITGVVIRVNRRTVSIKTANGGEWKVSPVFLTKIREQSATSAASKSGNASSPHNDRNVETFPIVAYEKNQFP